MSTIQLNWFGVGHVFLSPLIVYQIVKKIFYCILLMQQGALLYTLYFDARAVINLQICLKHSYEPSPTLVYIEGNKSGHLTPYNILLLDVWHVVPYSMPITNHV